MQTECRVKAPVEPGGMQALFPCAGMAETAVFRLAWTLIVSKTICIPAISGQVRPWSSLAPFFAGVQPVFGEARLPVMAAGRHGYSSDEDVFFFLFF